MAGKEKLVFSIEATNKKFRDAINDSAKRTENLEANLASLGSRAGVAFAGLAASVGFFTNEAAKIETINTQFEVLTGSVLGAEKAVSQLQELSATTPFAFEDIAAAGKQLLGFGFSVDSLTENLSNLGDVAAASGTPIQELSLIFGQVQAAGKLTGERLLQLQERAIPIGPALAKSLGVAESSIRDLVSQGKVDFATFQEAFRSLSKEGGFAFGGLDKQSQTLSGQISTLGDNFSLLSAEIGQQFLPLAKQVTTALINVFTELRNNPELLKTAANILKVATVSAGLVAGVTGLTLAFVKLKAVLVGVGAVLSGIAGLISLPAIAIGTLVAAVAGLGLAWDTNLSIVENLTENFAQRIFALFGGIGKIIVGAFTLDLSTLKEGLAEASIAFAERGADIRAQRQALDDDRRARQEQEIQEEKAKQELLIEQEQVANERKLEAQRAAAEQKRQVALEQAEIDREVEAELREIQLETEQEFTNAQIEALRAELLKKAQLKQESFAKDLLTLREQKKKEIAETKKAEEAKTTLEKFQQDERTKNAKQFASATIQLQRSSNSTIKSIGKAGALTNIAINTAEGAIKAYQSLAGIPLIGPALGAAAAGAVIAFGAEQSSAVLAAQTGGRVEGIGRGDRVPAMLEPGELVVPRQSFEDVIQAEAARREAESGAGSGLGGIMEVIIGFRDEAFELIEEKLIERRRIDGVGLGALG